MQVTAIVTGALAVVLGGDVFWSLTGLLIGQMLGGTVMALHAAQGPQLGLPQMISSRVQFGVYGAIIPIIAVCLMYIGFSATGTVLAGEALGNLLDVRIGTGIVIFSGLIVIFTALGYRMLHLLGRAASVVGVLAFCVMFARLFEHQDIAALLAMRHFSLNTFLLAMSLSASWQTAYGPYVADYSRYLPRPTSGAGVFAAVWLGSVLGSQIAMTFGVLAVAANGARFEHHEVEYIVGLGGAGLVANALYASIAFSKVMITSLNAYGSFMSMATIASGFRRRLQLTAQHRLIYILSTVCLSSLLALLGRDSFLKSFETFILFLLTVLTPWSAINLVDYYCFTRSRYDIQALADPDGIYGRWNLRGIIVYCIGILMQIPFVSSAFYTGPLVGRLGGADISWLVGLVGTGALYYAVVRASRR